MKLAIIHLSDIHIESEDDFIFQHIDKFYRSCKHLINECSKLIIVITGDIAFHGKKEEYDIAYKWLHRCEEAWRKEATYLNSIEYVVVPGNHDCDFSQEDSIRELIISQVIKQDKLEDDNFAKHCLKVQSSFWEFYSKLRNEEIIPQIAWVHNIRLKLDFSIKFNCYNSAFLSQKQEAPGKLIIPENYFIKSDDVNQNLVISLFHHNTGWLTPNTPHNNKKIFEQHLYSTSNIVMCGHEHSNMHVTISNVHEFEELIYLENAAFQHNGLSEFGLFLLDSEANVIMPYTYSFQQGTYKENKGLDRPICKRQSGIILSSDWERSLDNINVPLTHIHKEHLALSDIFVFPDLEPFVGPEIKNIQYIDSSTLLDKSQSGQIVVLEGDNQSGKSSLMQMLFAAWYKKGIYPVMLYGKQIKTTSILKLFKEVYEEQYQCNEYTYDLYMQLDRNKRILLIDDFDECLINSKGKFELLKKSLLNFDRIVVTIGQQTALESLLFCVNGTDNLKHYRILSLGYQKRNDLIEKWLSIGQDEFVADKDIMFNQIKKTYDQISTLLGQQLIPSYPVFILSLLQGLNQSLGQFDVSKTSYSYCYNSLIIASLLKTGTDKDKINGVLKFLCEFAYYFYNSMCKDQSFDEKDFDKFHETYKTEYNVPYNAGKLRAILCNADLIRIVEEGCYTFAYKYVYYFLVAQKISQLINDGKENDIVQKLCDNLHKEQEANILIFLVYHNGIEKQMEDLLFASMLPFENYYPVTLNTDDSLFNRLNNIIDDIKSKIMLQNIDPKQNRNVTLRNSDKIHRELNQVHQPSEEDFEENQSLRDINNTIKIIKILGQIVKNQMETLRKEQILKLLEESYNVCFRSIAFLGEMIESSKDEFIEALLEKHKGKINIEEREIKIKVQKILYLLLYQFCLKSFANLAFSVGTSDSPETYDDIAKKIGTPAAKIISFTIKTYYNKMRLKDLKEIVNEYRNNPVIMEIIKSRVLNYVYNNYVDFKDRQKIGQICDLKIVNNGIILQNNHETGDIPYAKDYPKGRDKRYM